MNYVRTLCLLCVMGSMLLIANPAAASVVTSPAGTVYTGTIKAESEGHVVLHSENASFGGFTVECNSKVEGEIGQHGVVTTANGKVSNLSFTGCTNGITVVVNNPGTLEVHDLETGNGTLTSSGAEITIHVPAPFNVKCIYTTTATDIGTLTGSKNTGATATLDLNSSTITRTGGSVFCGTGGFFTGSYKVTTPDYLDVSKVDLGTAVTSPAGTVYTGTIKAESEGHVVLDSETAPTPFTIPCNSSLEASVEMHGPSNTAAGKVGSLTFSGCTNGATVIVNKPGTLEVHNLGNGNGTLTSSGAEITIHVPLGFKCVYTTNETDIGTLTGSKNTGTTATLDLSSSTIKRTGGSAFCGTGGFLTGGYKVTGPDYLDVSEGVPGSVVTSPAGTVYTGTIKAESNGHVVLHSEKAPLAFDVECNSTLEGNVEQHGPSIKAGGKLSGLTFTNCTNGVTVVVKKLGTFEVHDLENGDGMLTSSGAEIQVTVHSLGIICTYATEQTEVRTLTGSKNTKSTARLDLISPTVLRTGGSFCGSGGTLTGSYKVTTPDYLDVS